MKRRCGRASDMSWKSVRLFLAGADSFVTEGQELHKVVVDSERSMHS